MICVSSLSRASSGAYASSSFSTFRKTAVIKAAEKKKGKEGEGQVSTKLQRVIDMLLPQEQRSGKGGVPSRDNPVEFSNRLAEYELKQSRIMEEWKQEMLVKHSLQRAAIRALTPELRMKAEEPDVSAFPPNRQYYFQSPPESYRDHK
jgi:hypothetical protein